MEAARRAAYDSPWSHAVLRALELKAYRKLPGHLPGWIAARIGLTPAQEEESLKLLRDTGQIRRRRGRFEVVEAGLVDTRPNPDAARRLREFWAVQAAERVKAQPSAAFAYNLFSVSLADLERIRGLHRAYFRELRAIVSQSEPAETLALVTMSLLELNAAEPSSR